MGKTILIYSGIIAIAIISGLVIYNKMFSDVYEEVYVTSINNSEKFSLGDVEVKSLGGSIRGEKIIFTLNDSSEFINEVVLKNEYYIKKVTFTNKVVNSKSDAYVFIKNHNAFKLRQDIEGKFALLSMESTLIIENNEEVVFPFVDHAYFEEGETFGITYEWGKNSSINSFSDLSEYYNVLDDDNVVIDPASEIITISNIVCSGDNESTTEKNIVLTTNSEGIVISIQ